MFDNLRLSAKVSILMVGISGLVGTGIGIASYMTARDSMDALTTERLLAAANTGKTQINEYLKSIESQLVLIAEHPGTVAAVKDFSAEWKTWEELGGNPEVDLQKAYITDNPHPTGEKQNLVDAMTGSGYDAIHAKYHPWFHQFQKTEGYYDVFLFDTSGNLVYSVFKELDYATNFNASGGKWADSDLGVVFREALSAADKNAIVFRDFKPYAPSFDAPASFMAHAVYDENGQEAGVLVFQMPIDRINGLMAHNMGLGKTGELALIGDDFLMRNDSASTVDVNDILQTKLDSEVVREAFAKGKAFGYDRLHRDELMDLEAVTFDYQNVNYAIIAMQSDAEANAPVAALRNRMLLVGGALLIVAAVLGLLASRSIVNPIKAVVLAMNRLATGKTDINLAGVDRTDEIGEMVRAVDVFRENALQRAELEVKAGQERDRERQGQSHLENVIKSFRSAMSDKLSSVTSQMDVMRQSSNVLLEIAEELDSKASMASSSSSSASDSVASVAGATEEMTSTVKEIASQTDATSRIVTETVQATDVTNQNVAALSEAANHIGSVVNLIRDIAEQTNLLALNATIEAARAGEAGRGFAVVASEVKELAEQTSKATNEISERIEGIQNSVEQAATSISDITEKVNDILALTTSVSGAVEEQQAATSEIAQSARLAAEGTESASASMSEVASAIERSRAESNAVRSSTTMVSDANNELASEVEVFLNEVSRELQDQRREMRVPMSEEIQVLDHTGRKGEARIVDISRYGAQLAGVRDVKRGDTITLFMQNEQEIHATVVRETELGVGVEFVTALAENDALLAA